MKIAAGALSVFVMLTPVASAQSAKGHVAHTKRYQGGGLADVWMSFGWIYDRVLGIPFSNPQFELIHKPSTYPRDLAAVSLPPDGRSCVFWVQDGVVKKICQTEASGEWGSVETWDTDGYGQVERIAAVGAENSGQIPTLLMLTTDDTVLARFYFRESWYNCGGLASAYGQIQANDISAAYNPDNFTVNVTVSTPTNYWRSRYYALTCTMDLFPITSPVGITDIATLGTSAKCENLDCKETGNTFVLSGGKVHQTKYGVPFVSPVDPDTGAAVPLRDFGVTGALNVSQTLMYPTFYAVDTTGRTWTRLGPQIKVGTRLDPNVAWRLVQ